MSANSHPLRRLAVKGSIVHPISFDKIEIVNDGAILYGSNGVIEKLIDLSSPSASDELATVDSVIDFTGKLIIPGLVDAHCHAPQYAFTGTGMDLPLLKWLEQYTFPCETKFSNETFANDVYRKSVMRHLKCGTTFASYFATIHKTASKLLVDIANEIGQRAYIGKVSMDRNSPDTYIENTEEGLADEEEFIRYVLSLTQTGQDFLAKIDKGVSLNENEQSLVNKETTPLIMPVVTPRFVPTCSMKMMVGLAELSNKYGVPVQSHLCESTNEIAWVKELHPEQETYTEVYHAAGLLHKRCYMAHCCYCNPAERGLLKSTGTGVVHCPCSNFMIMSGIADVRMYKEEGIEVGLGTDVAAGYSPSILDCLRQTITASRCLELKYRGTTPASSPYVPLNYREAFYLATQGGANVLGMGDVLGNFKPGKKMDCLVVDVSAPGSPIDTFGGEDTLEKFEKFLFLGDDRNIIKIFVDGNCVI